MDGVWSTEYGINGDYCTLDPYSVHTPHITIMGTVPVNGLIPRLERRTNFPSISIRAYV